MLDAEREASDGKQGQVEGSLTREDGLREAIAPFVRLARGIPDNWHGELTLLIEQFGNGIRIKSCPVMDPTFPLIVDWWALIDAYEAADIEPRKTPEPSVASAPLSQTEKETE